MTSNGCCGAKSGDPSTDDFQLSVGKVTGNCNIGEEWASGASKEGKIPVLSCEGPCAKGEIARRAATFMPRFDSRFERACHGEAFFVPHSSMAKWVANAEQVVMIDGCFLTCHGRVLANLVDEAKIIHVNAHAIHKEFGDTFSYDDISDEELSSLAEQVADETISIAADRLSAIDTGM